MDSAIGKFVAQQGNLIDAEFWKEGIREREFIAKRLGSLPFDEHMKAYMAARWYIFCMVN